MHRMQMPWLRSISRRSCAMIKRASANETLCVRFAFSCLVCNRRHASQTTGHVETLRIEDIETAKDEDAAKKLVKYGFLIVWFAGVIYLGNKWASKKYGREDMGAMTAVKRQGKPSLGGPFVLVDTDGKLRSQREFLDSWQIFYFGFVNCPEICPIELNRMSKVVDGVRDRFPGIQVLPLFVSCDPQRDSLSYIEDYVKDFHPDFVGMVGTPDMVDRVCKSYRIYYSTPDETAKQSEDYLIDHSIAIYVFDPQGRFVDFFGTRWSEEEILEKMTEYVQNYNADSTWTTW